MIRRWLVLVVGLVACIPSAAMRRGDAAAARGDWRAAEAEYRVAVQRDPKDLELARKYGDAKQQAIAAALRTAEACKASRDATCVDRELTYVLTLDAGNVAAARTRAEARTELASEALGAARRSLQSNNPLETWNQLARVRSLGIPSGSEEEVARLEQEAAGRADDIARSMIDRAGSLSPNEAIAVLTEARALASGAAARNAQFSATLSQVDAARQRLVADEVARQSKVGDEALDREDYDGAARAYLAATQISNEPRLKARYTYAGFMGAAVRAIAQRDFTTASTHLQSALATQLDRGRARDLLDEVSPRVYRIRLESVMITPTKPGTTDPWVGPPWWRDVAPAVAGVAASFYAGPAAGLAAEKVTKAVVNVPTANRPGLMTFVDLPDGRRFRTKTVKGIYVIYGSEFSVYSNKLDTRTVRLSVFTDRNDSVAVINVPLGQIISGKIDVSALQGNASALQQVIFAVDPTETWRDGSYSNLEPQDQGENGASARSLPSQSTSRVQLKTATLALPSDGTDGDGSRPDPFLEIHQGGKRILKSTTKQDTRSTDWSFAMTDLNVSATEQLVVRLIDADVASDDQLATWDVPARDLLSGQVRLSTTTGTMLILSTEPRSDRPR